MPIVTIPGLRAMANVKESAVSTWPTRGDTGSRLEPMARPHFTPGFRFAAGERIFTIGSCFARNIEALLEQCGFAIPTRAIIKADPDFAAIGHSILNNYGTPSILNEIRWALDPATPFDEAAGFFEIYPGRFVDAHLNHSLKPAPIETVRARRRAITGAYRALIDCRVVIVTLGLAECWYDTVGGSYLNTAPRRTMIRAEPDRFELRVLGHDEILATLDEALALIRQNGPADMRVILTVSPVPLTSTFREIDVMVANSYSKAVLRAAAEAVTAGHDFVDYYPSYESVTLSERSVALLDDLIHPTAEIVWLNTSRMVRAYVGADALGPQDIRDAIAENPMAALSLIGEREELIADDPELAVALLAAAGRAGRFDLMALAVPHVGDLMPAVELDIARARIALADGDAAGAVALLGEQPARRGARGTYWSTKLAAHIALGDLDAARIVAMGWSEANSRTAEPFRQMGVAYARADRPVAADSMFQAALGLIDDDPRTQLDYSDFLATAGRRADAAALIDRVHPANPSHTERLARLRLWLAADERSVSAKPAFLLDDAH